MSAKGLGLRETRARGRERGCDEVWVGGQKRGRWWMMKGQRGESIYKCDKVWVGGKKRANIEEVDAKKAQIRE